MRAMIAFLLVCVLVCGTSGRDFVPSQTSPDREPIAVASIHIDKHRFKSGEDIQLMKLANPGGRRANGGRQRLHGLLQSFAHQFHAAAHLEFGE